MLEQFFIRPQTVDRIRGSWVGPAIEKYVAWLVEHRYAARNVFRRVPILMCFGEFARARGADSWDQLPEYVEVFADQWCQDHGGGRKREQARHKVFLEARNPVEQMLRLVLPDFAGTPRSKMEWPFQAQAPGFLDYLKTERGLRPKTIELYQSWLGTFDAYLRHIGLADLADLRPAIVTAFLVDQGGKLHGTSMRGQSSILRTFLRYLFRQELLSGDLSRVVDSPRTYRHSGIPRSIPWKDVHRVLDAVDRRSAMGKRDYAILLLLVIYGLRAREVAPMTLDDIDWRNARLRVPERKAGHSTAFPLSATVGEALADYIRHGRTQTSDRHVFFRAVAPLGPISTVAVSSVATKYLKKAGIDVRRPGSHTLRHTCVQRLVDEGFSFKEIGDFVGHRSPDSTTIYAKVAVETLRQVSLGDGEEVLR